MRRAGLQRVGAGHLFRAAPGATRLFHSVNNTKDGPGARPATRPLSILAGRGRSSALEECPGTSLVKEPIRALRSMKRKVRSMERRVRSPKCVRNPRNERSALGASSSFRGTGHPFRGRHNSFHEMGRIFSGTVHPFRGTDGLFAKQFTGLKKYGKGRQTVNRLLTRESNTGLYWLPAGKPDSLLSGQSPEKGRLRLVL